jgi:hypothetical protein
MLAADRDRRGRRDVLATAAAVYTARAVLIRALIAL